MKKALIIGLIVCVLVIGGIGAVFATDMEFTNVGALSLGTTPVEDIDCTDVGFHLDSQFHDPVAVDGVYLRFIDDIVDAAFSVSLRGETLDLVTGEPVELCYCARNGHNQAANTTWLFSLTAEDGDLPGPEEVFHVKITVGNDSVFNTGGAGNVAQLVTGDADPFN